MNKEQEAIVEEKGLDKEAVKAYLELGNDNLENFEESHQGKWVDDVEFVKELLEDLGDIPADLPVYVHIDWEGTARDVMMDYSEQDGHYFRNI